MRAFQGMADGGGGCQPFCDRGVNRQDRHSMSRRPMRWLALYRLSVPVLLEDLNGAGKHRGMSEQIPRRVG